MSDGGRYRDLKYLMERFHQDWNEIHKSDTDLLLDFARVESPALVQRVIADIRRITKDNPEPRKVDALLTRQWHAETPYRSPMDALKWLQQTAGVLEGAKRAGGKARLPETSPSRPNIERYPGLYLLMCQFDSDWETVFGSEANVLRQFKKLNARKDVEACVGDIKRALSANYSDDDLVRMLKEEFGAHPPFTRKAEARAWLNRILVAYHDVKPGAWTD